MANQIKLKGDYTSRRVWLDGKEIFPSIVLNYSDYMSKSFDWGDKGMGCRQLAFEICRVLLFDEKDAFDNHWSFNELYIVDLPEKSDFDVSLEIAFDEENPNIKDEDRKIIIKGTPCYIYIDDQQDTQFYSDDHTKCDISMIDILKKYINLFGILPSVGTNFLPGYVDEITVKKVAFSHNNRIYIDIDYGFTN